MWCCVVNSIHMINRDLHSQPLKDVISGFLLSMDHYLVHYYLLYQSFIQLANAGKFKSWNIISLPCILCQRYQQFLQKDVDLTEWITWEIILEAQNFKYFSYSLFVFLFFFLLFLEHLQWLPIVDQSFQPEVWNRL